MAAIATRRSSLPALSLLVCLVASGCRYAPLRENLAQLENYGSVRGTLTRSSPGDAPVVVALIGAATSSGSVYDYEVLSEAGSYYLTGQDGAYLVLAFEDRDRDRRYTPGVDVAAAPVGGHPVELGNVARVQGIDFTLAASPAPALARAVVLPPEGERGARALPNLSAGVVAGWDDPRFSPANGQLGLWRPVDFVFDVGSGVFFIEPNVPEKIPVLFVHGLGGNPSELRALGEALDASRFQPWVACYPSGLRVEDTARGLARALRSIRARHGDQPILVVAHSMGGLVAQATIERMGDDPNVLALMTIATPWGGMSSAEIGVERSPLVIPSWRDLAPGSEFLKAANARALPAGIPHFLLFGYGGGSLLSRQASDSVVPIRSQLDPQIQSRAQRVLGFDEDHTSILRSADVAQTLREILAPFSRGGIAR